MVYIGFEEIWKPICIKEKYKTHYSVSNFGKIRNDNTGKLIKPSKIRKYYIISIPYINNKGERKKYGTSISRFVAMAFIPIPKKYLDMGLTYKDLDVDHIRDGDENNHEDNSIYNLQWITHEENVKKAELKGLYEKMNLKGTKQPTWDWMVGELNSNAKYNEKLVRKICKDIEANKMSIKDIAKKHDIPLTFIYDILNGRAWKHISKDYNLGNYNKRRNQYDTHTDADRALLDELIQRGATNAEIYKILNLDPIKYCGWVYRHRKKLGCPRPTKTKVKKTKSKKNN